MKMLPCGCCKTGGEYVARHLDPHNLLTPDAKPSVLAAMLLDMYGEVVPSHVPDRVTLAKWIAMRQNQLRRESVPA